MYRYVEVADLLGINHFRVEKLITAKKIKFIYQKKEPRGYEKVLDQAGVDQLREIIEAEKKDKEAPKDVVNSREAAKIMGLCPSTIIIAHDRGDLKVRYGITPVMIDKTRARHLLFKRADVEKAAEKLKKIRG